MQTILYFITLVLLSFFVLGGLFLVLREMYHYIRDMDDDPQIPPYDDPDNDLYND